MLADIIGYIKDASAAGGPLAIIFAILWWLERNERQDAQKELKVIAQESFTTMAELKIVVSNLSQLFHAALDRRK